MEQQKDNTMTEIDLRKWAVYVWRHWYWFVIGVVLCVGLGVLHLAQSTPKMTTSASLQIRDVKQGLSLGGASSALSMLGMTVGSEVDDEILILKSRDLMSQALNDLDLWTEYRVKEDGKWKGEFPRHTFTVEVLKWEERVGSCKVTIKIRKDGKYKVTVRRGKLHRSSVVLNDLMEPIETCAGTIHITQNCPAKEDCTTYRAFCAQHLSVVDSYRKRVTIALGDKGSRVVNLSINSDMPVRDVALLNKLIEQYNLNAQLDRDLLASSTGRFIDERIEKVTKELGDAETAVADYKKANKIADLHTEAKLALEANGEEQKQIASVKVQLDMVDYIEEFVKDETKKYSLIPANIGAADGTSVIDASLASFISEYNNMLLRRMRILRTATESNPVVEQLNAQLDVMRQNIIAGVGTARESLNIALKGLEQSDSKFATRMQTVPTQEQEYVRIVRQQKIKEEMYLYLYQKREENNFALAASALSARIVDTPKVDTESVTPKTKNILFISVVLGLLIPAILLFLLEFFSGKIGDEQEYKRQAKIPFAGRIAKGNGGVLRNWKNGAEEELFRKLRTNVQYLLPEGVEHPVLLVTSCVAGEGKSHVAANLAQSLALLNKKVVLVDVNLRQPTHDNTMGVTEYLCGKATDIHGLIKGMEGLGAPVDYISCGAPTETPAELLQVGPMDKLIESLKQEYDYIVLDTAPVSEVCDTMVLAKQADMTLMVSCPDTSYGMVERINDIAENKRMPNMVGVFNKAE